MHHIIADLVHSIYSNVAVLVHIFSTVGGLSG